MNLICRQIEIGKNYWKMEKNENWYNLLQARQSQKSYLINWKKNCQIKVFQKNDRTRVKNS